MKHRIGYIGYAGMGGGYHYEVAKDRADVCDDLAPVAVYDVRQCQRDLAVERGLIAYDNLEDLLANDEIDTVVVATPNQFHCELTCKALRAGKHVICEKPAAMSPAELQTMIDTANETGKLLFIHQNRRFDRDFMLVKHAIETGRLGKVYNIESKFCGGLMSGWRSFKDHGGGIFYDWGVHLIDQMVYLFNEPVKSVYADLRCEKSGEVDDRSTVEITFASGAKARVTVCGSFLAPYNRFEVYGEKGVMWVDDIYAESGTLRASTKSEWKTSMTTAYNENGPYEREERHLEEDLSRVTLPDDMPTLPQDWAKYLYKNIFDTIDGNAEMIVTHEQAMTVLRIIDAAFKSSETGKIIEF